MHLTYNNIKAAQAQIELLHEKYKKLKDQVGFVLEDPVKDTEWNQIIFWRHHQLVAQCASERWYPSVFDILNL